MAGLPPGFGPPITPAGYSGPSGPVPPGYGAPPAGQQFEDAFQAPKKDTGVAVADINRAALTFVGFTIVVNLLPWGLRYVGFNR